eukprot:tig00000622_g2632.t1
MSGDAAASPHDDAPAMASAAEPQAEEPKPCPYPNCYRCILARPDPERTEALRDVLSSLADRELAEMQMWTASCRATLEFVKAPMLAKHIGATVKLSFDCGIVPAMLRLLKERLPVPFVSIHASDILQLLLVSDFKEEIALALARDALFLPAFTLALRAGNTMTKHNLCSVLQSLFYVSKQASLLAACADAELVSALVACANLPVDRFREELASPLGRHQADILKPKAAVDEIMAFAPRFVEMARDRAVSALSFLVVPRAELDAAKLHLLQIPDFLATFLREIRAPPPPPYPESSKASRAAEALAVLCHGAGAGGSEGALGALLGGGAGEAVVAALEGLLGEDREGTIALFRALPAFRPLDAPDQETLVSTLRARDQLKAPLASCLASLAAAGRRSRERLAAAGAGPLAERLVRYGLSFDPASSFRQMVIDTTVIKGLRTGTRYEIFHFCPSFVDSALAALNALRPEHTGSVATEELLRERAGAAKERGAAAFRKEDHDYARVLYSTALALAPPGDPLRCVLHSNRAECLLKLHRFHEALADAEAALALSTPEHELRAKFQKRKERAQEGITKALADGIASVAVTAA